MSQQLCLKWNNHNSAFNNSLNKYFLEDLYSDGTILCDGKFYPVHRFVLSTCSEYFEEIFHQCLNFSNKHPFIIIKDIQSDHMEALLNYMYKGEVNVPQEMLPDLIKAAELFKIKGLAVPDDDSLVSKKRPRSSCPTSVPKKSKDHKEKFQDFQEGSSDECNNENVFNKTVTSTKPQSEEFFISEPPTQKIKVEESIPISEDTLSIDPFPNYLKLDPKLDKYYYEEDSNPNSVDLKHSSKNINAEELASTSWDNSQTFLNNDETEEEHNNFIEASMKKQEECSKNQDINTNSPSKECPYPSCHYRSCFSWAVKRHYRKHTGEKPYKCPLCPLRTAQKHSINIHIKTVHSNVKPFECPHCPFKTAHKSYLKPHIYTKHSDLQS